MSSPHGLAGLLPKRSSENQAVLSTLSFYIHISPQLMQLILRHGQGTKLIPNARAMGATGAATDVTMTINLHPRQQYTKLCMFDLRCPKRPRRDHAT